MTFLQHDEGDSSLSNWRPDVEPVPPPKDSWSRGSVPVRTVTRDISTEIDTTARSFYSKQSSQRTHSRATTPAGKTPPHTLKPTPLPHPVNTTDPDDVLRDTVERRRRQLEAAKREQQRLESGESQSQVVFFNAVDPRKLPSSRYASQTIYTSTHKCCKVLRRNTLFQVIKHTKQKGATHERSNQNSLCNICNIDSTFNTIRSTHRCTL